MGGLGWIHVLASWVGLDWVKKNGPTSVSGPFLRPVHRKARLFQTAFTGYSWSSMVRALDSRSKRSSVRISAVPLLDNNLASVIKQYS